MSSLEIGILTGLLAAVGFGVGDFFAARALHTHTHWQFIFWSQLLRLAGFILAFVILGWQLRLTGLAIMFALLSGMVFLIGLRFTLKAFKIGPVSLASPFIGTYALVATVLSLIFLGEHLRPVQLVAVVLLVSGAMLASVSGITHRPTKDFWSTPTVRLALTGAMCIGVSVVFLAQLVHEAGWQTALLLQAIVMVSGSALGIRLSKAPFISANSRPINMSILGFTVFGTLGGVMLSVGFSSSLVAIVTPVAATSPLITVCLALYFFKEKLSRYQLSGALVVIFGLVLLSVR